MKKRNRFRNYLSFEALVILLVILSFRVIPDKKTASMVTSFLFIGSSLGILYWETRYADYRKRASFWGVLVFLVFSAIPVFLLRVLNWDMAFDDIQVAGITGTEMHKFSNYVFILMMICFFIDSYLERIREREREDQL
jgi:uncharacterized membrane protein